jgi:hypothetical protein
MGHMTKFWATVALNQNVRVSIALVSITTRSHIKPVRCTLIGNCETHLLKIGLCIRPHGIHISHSNTLSNIT